MFYVGQKVVCINDSFPLRVLEFASNLPRKGQIYTICSIFRGRSITTGKLKVGFRLEELQNGRFGFFADRFVPLVEKLDQACQRNASEITSPVWVSPAMTVSRDPQRNLFV